MQNKLFLSKESLDYLAILEAKNLKKLFFSIYVTFAFRTSLFKIAGKNLFR